MENKKVIILAVLAVFAAISLVYGIKNSGKRAVKSASPSVASLTSGGESKTVYPTERKYRRSEQTWRRNSFVPAGTSTSTNLVLSGIIWNKDKPKAMIGDMIVAKGDSINNNKVVDIRPDKVILNDGVKDFELKLEK